MDSRSRPSRAHARVSYREPSDLEAIEQQVEEEEDEEDDDSVKFATPEVDAEASRRKNRIRSRLRRKGTPRYHNNNANDNVVNTAERTRSGRAVKPPVVYIPESNEPSPQRTFSKRLSARRSSRRTRSKRAFLGDGSDEEFSDDEADDHMSFDDEDEPSHKRPRRDPARITVRRGEHSDEDNTEDHHEDNDSNLVDDAGTALRDEMDDQPNAAEGRDALADKLMRGAAALDGEAEAGKESEGNGVPGAADAADGGKKSIKLRVRVKPVKEPNGGSGGSADSEEPVRRTRSVARQSKVIDGGDDDGDDDFKPKSDDESNEEDSGADAVVAEEPSSSSQSEFNGVRTRNRKRRAAAAPAKRPRRDTRSSAPSRSLPRASRFREARRSAPERPRTRSERRPPTRNTARRDALDSYRPTRARNTPRDFYEQDSSSDSSSSDDEFLGSARAGNKVSSPRVPGSSGAGAPAPGAAPDFFANPMALLDGNNRRNPSRYARRRNRNQKAGVEPFAVDKRGKPRTNFVGIEPIQVDLNLKWEDIGGLDHHIRALKEMVFLPLMYPEVFEKFKMEPPKGVLFYGPPGTGKTLCARTLAASCGGDPVVEAAAKPNASAVHEALKKVSNALKPAAPVPDGFIVGSAQAVEGAAGLTVEGGSGNTAAMDAVKNNPALQQAAAGLLSASAANKPADPSATATASKSGDGTGTAGAGGSDEIKARRPRVAFFMRNGADCLSKWVGEAERQLRMTFEAAKLHQPAIIFFDEIDGLAPVRSSRQDQIHSSIVSTLLGLMDGLDSRGRIVVIGATNRVDAIDPALRRPGRFDRELIFTLPNRPARRRILEIQTADWKPQPPRPQVLDAVAERTVGYCGADLKSLCAEATLRALRRRYPQIYKSQDKLLIKVDEVRVTTKDFSSAMNDIVPASHRSAKAFASPLSPRLEAVLSAPLRKCVDVIKRIFPQGIPPSMRKKNQSAGHPLDGVPNGINTAAVADDDDEDLSDVISDEDFDEKEFETSLGSKRRDVHGQSSAALRGRPVLRPRLLVCGKSGHGQMQLGPALLHFLEGCPVHSIDMASLHMNSSARTSEEALVSAVREACRAAPSVLYLPHLHLWWNMASELLQSTLVIALKDIPGDLPLLFLTTADEELDSLPDEITDLIGDTVVLQPAEKDAREAMFAPVVAEAVAVPKVSEAMLRRKRDERRAEVLPKAPPPPPVILTPRQSMEKSKEDDMYIRELRMTMRDFVEKQLRDRKFKAFWTPVQPSEAPDYYKIVKDPMDLSKIAAHVDKGMYPTVASMVRDFDLMFKNAIDYNPAHTEEGSAIIRRAHGLVDIVHAWVDNLNPLLVERCNQIVANRLQVHARQLEEKAKKAAAEEAEKTATEKAKATAERVAAEKEVGQPSDRNGDVDMADVERSTAGEAQVAEKMDVDDEDDTAKGEQERGRGVPLPRRRSSTGSSVNGEQDSGAQGPKKILRISDLLTANGSGGGEFSKESASDEAATSAEPVTSTEVRQNAEAAGTVVKTSAAADTGSGPEEGGSVQKDKNVVEEPPARLAKEAKVERLKTLLADVTSGITVDGLERLHVQCATLLHKYRRSTDRARVVEELKESVKKARVNPAIVGEAAK